MNSTCSHLLQFRCQKGGLKNYMSLLPRLVFPIEASKVELKQHLANCEVHGCSADKCLITCCFSCCTFRCLHHLREHLWERDHSFGILLENGEIYCGECSDFVYDSVLDAVRTKNHNAYLAHMGLPRLVHWAPKIQEIQDLPPRPHTSIDAQAIRGLMNLGNTCFLNSIVQALVHTPSLRDFFLADQHCRCQLEDCLMCVVSQVYQEVYGCSWRDPYMPAKLLTKVWKSSCHLAGYHQQDAHEFLITLLELLHSHSKPPDSPITQSADCKCIIDKLFTGLMQSELVCSDCGNVSTRIESFMDVALNVPPDDGKENAPATLEKCLEKFVQMESMHCTTCGQCSQRRITKQLTFKKLPVVTVFQLKRFEHLGQARKKVNSVVNFPKELDMTAYLSSFISKHDEFDERINVRNALNRTYNKYTLYAVVQHVGSMDTGHYTCFVRRKECWYQCDDAMVYPVREEDVFSAEGYLLFYQTSTLKSHSMGSPF